LHFGFSFITGEFSFQAVKITAFTWIAVVPFSLGSGSKIERTRKQLSEQKAFDNFIHTPELSFLESARPLLDLKSFPPSEVRDLSPLKMIGTFFVIVRLSGTSFNLDQASALIRRCMTWVRTVLSSNDANDWIPFTYPIFILQGSQPSPTKKGLNEDKEILKKVVLPSLPPELRFGESSIDNIFSHDIGYLESDFYKFSSYGALFYSANYSRSNNYIDEVMVPIVGRLRQAQATLETLNEVLDSRIKRVRSNNVAEGYRTVADLRESVLTILSDTNYSQVFQQRAEVSELLIRIFGVRSMERVIQRKVKILNSILDSINQKQIEKATAASDRTNILLTILTLVVAVVGVLLTIPPLARFIFGP